MNEDQRQAWNAALASGDQARIERVRDEILLSILARIMSEDQDLDRLTRK